MGHPVDPGVRAQVRAGSGDEPVPSPLRLRDVHRKAIEVGFNATRRYRDDKSNDIWLLVAAGLVLGGGLLWAFGLF